MKKYISLFLAAGALALTGCVEESLPKEDGNEITIQAVMAENPGTRTMIQDGTTSVLWEPGDEVKLFYKTTGSRFTSNNTEPSGTADFTGNLTITGFFGEGFTADTPLWAVYPYRADATSDGESVTTTLPAEQTGRAGSFAKSTNITLAKSSNTKMGFYNVCGGVRFSLTQEGVKEVVFQGQNDESIAGKVKLTFVDGVPAIQEVTEGQKTITLTAPNNGTFETGKWYYIVALPGTLSNGFKMTFNTETQYATLKSSGSKTIKRGVFGSLTDADEDLIYKDKGTEEPPTGNIVFADLAAKYACVAKFDTNGDGEVSVEEAEAATSFDGLFTDWKGVESFDEIRYFKNVHSLNGVFNGCNKLVSITVPENITDLGSSAFNSCSALTSVVLPSDIVSIGNYTFQNCCMLNSIVIPSNVISIGQYAFAGCSVLSGINLPSAVCSIGPHAFQNCKAIGSLVLPEGIESIPDYCFQNCTDLASVSLPNSVITIGNYAFDGCRFEENNYTLMLPSSLTRIGSNAFGYIRHLLLPSKSPITITSNSFVDNYTLLYVPANMVEMYKVRTNWSNYADRIRSIDDYPIPFTIGGTVGDAVDLGLNVKWASWNVGASAPEEYGAYFAWGEVEPKQTYEWITYKWCNGDGLSLTKYNHDSNHGIVDGKVVLDLEDDAAWVNWGGNWRMPGYSDVSELTNTRSDSNYKWEWKAINGHNGWEITYLVNGNSVFLPAAGNPNYFWAANNDGYYWIRSYAPYDSPIYAYALFLNSSDVFRSGSRYWSRYQGLSVRPVCD